MEKKRLVAGVGINDSPSPTYKEEVIDGKRVVLWRDPIYVLWVNMLSRCYLHSHQRKRPTYEGCSVAECWKTYSVFRDWVKSKNGWEGKSLDKDLKIPSNTVYGPDTCLFVSKELNNFLNENANQRGDYPLGVHRRKDRKGRYRCSADTGSYFHTPSEAHFAWLEYKISIIDSFILEEEGEVRDALRRFKAILSNNLENKTEYKGRDYV